METLRQNIRDLYFDVVSVLCASALCRLAMTLSISYHGALCIYMIFSQWQLARRWEKKNEKWMKWMRRAYYMFSIGLMWCASAHNNLKQYTEMRELLFIVLYIVDEHTNIHIHPTNKIQCMLLLSRYPWSLTLLLSYWNVDAEWQRHGEHRQSW